MKPALLEIDYQPYALALGNGVAGHMAKIKTAGWLPCEFHDSQKRVTHYQRRHVIVRNVMFSIYVAEGTLQELIDNIIEFAGDRILKTTFEECFSDEQQTQVLEFLGKEGSGVVRRTVQDSQG